MELKNLARLTALSLVVAGVLYAEIHEAIVSREAQDLYRVEFIGRDLFVKTRRCYVYTYYEDALIDTDRMVIHFLDSDDECDIEKFLSECSRETLRSKRDHRGFCDLPGG